MNLIFKHTRQVRKQAVHKMNRKVFAAAEMTCIVENLFEDGEWAFLMWRNPLELCGYVFFHIKNGKIQFQSRCREHLRQCGILLPVLCSLRLNELLGVSFEIQIS